MMSRTHRGGIPPTSDGCDVELCPLGGVMQSIHSKLCGLKYSSNDPGVASFLIHLQRKQNFYDPREYNRPMVYCPPWFIAPRL